MPSMEDSAKNATHSKHNNNTTKQVGLLIKEQVEGQNSNLMLLIRVTTGRGGLQRNPNSHRNIFSRHP